MARRALVLSEVPSGGFVTARQVAAKLAMSESWVMKQVRLNNGFPFKRIGPKAVRFDMEEVHEWVKKNQGG